MSDDLLEVLREHAYGEISLEKCLTIMPTEHGAKVPGHWIEETDARIASVLPEETLRDELSRRKEEGK
jgi:hypothetical protein